MNVTQNWHWPQWAMVALILIDLIVRTANHGRPRDNYNGRLAIVDAALFIFILTCGGFFA